MRYQRIPGTDLNASVIGFGAADLGTAIDEESSFSLLDQYVELGGNLIDTAHVYGDWVTGGEKGVSEKTIGKWLAGRADRNRLIVSTKGAHPAMDGTNRRRVDADSIRSDLSDSLERLQTETIDLYWLHRDDPERPVEPIVEALHEQVEAGKIRAIGASNWRSDRIEEANRYARRNGLTPFVGSQLHWNLASLNGGMPEDIAYIDEREYDYYADSELAVFAYSSQAGGFFSGRYGRGMKPASDRARLVELMYANDESYARLDRVRELAGQLGISGTQAALSYLVSQPFAVFALAGANQPAYLQDCCGAGDIRLSPGQLQYLATGR